MSDIKYIASQDFSGLHFCPVQVERNRKSVEMYMSSKSTSWSNRVSFQLVENEDSPAIAKYNLSPANEDQDPTRINFTVCLDSRNHKQAIETLLAIDAKVKSEAVARSKEWWKKELTEEAIAFKYKPLVTYDSDNDNYCVRFKVVVPHPTPEPGRKYGKPTEVYVLSDDGTAKLTKNAASVLTSESEITPSLSTGGVWFMGENQFGVSLKADIILCKPKPQKTGLDRMTLKRKYAKVSEDSSEEKEVENKEETSAEKEEEEEEKAM